MVTLYLAMMIALRIPAVQQWMSQQVAAAISTALGTKVHIGRIDLGFFNRIIVDDVLINDQEHQEMLRADRLAAKIELLPLLEQRITISSAQLIGAKVLLYKHTAESPLNCQFVLDSLASGDTTSNSALNLRINSLIMRRCSFSYDEWDVAPTNGVLNTSHLKVTDISSYIILKTMTNDSLNANVKRLSCKEQSGLTVDKLSMKLEAGQQGAQLTELSLLMPQTQLSIDSLQATYDRKMLKQTLQFRGTIAPSTITTTDIAPAVQKLRNYSKTFKLQAAFNGTANSLALPSLTVTTPQGDISLKASGHLNDWEHPAGTLQISQLTIGRQAIAEASAQITTLPDVLLRIGDIHELKGRCMLNGNGSMEATAQARTEAGSIEADVDMNADKQFTGQILADDLNLQQLLADERFGMLSTQLVLNGKLNQNITAKGHVSHFGFQGYNYTGIQLEGTYSKDNMDGRFVIDDPHLSAHLHGSYNKPKVQIEGHVDHISPAALKLTDYWGNARFSADIDADFAASTLNDAQGVMSLRNFVMQEDDGQYRLNYLKVESGYEEQQHYVKINSDFAHAELKGEFDYATLPKSLTNLISTKLPTLPGMPAPGAQTHNDFTLNMTVDKTDWLQHLMGVDATLGRPMTIRADINDHAHHIELDADLPDFTYEGGKYSDGHLAITSPGDTLHVDALLTKQMDDGRLFKLMMDANAADNKLITSLTWDNEKRWAWKEEKGIGMTGRINAVGHFYKNMDEQPEAHLSILPSTVTVNGEAWQMEPSDILYATDRLLIDHFHIHNSEQSVKVNGIASKEKTDSVFIDLSNLEVAYILDLVNFQAVAFSGQATGRGYVSSAFNDASAHANLQVSHFKFEGGRMGVLTADVGWNKNEKQIDIKATANDGIEATTYINGYVSPERDYIDLGISARGSYLDFMHSFTKSFISNITGHGYGDLRLAGPLSAINLTGGMVVDGEATITALNTTYQLRSDTINFVYNDIQLNRIPVYDKQDNVAYMSGGIHHKDLTQLTFDLEVETDQLLGYDFKDFGDQSFYGTVYTAGKVTLQGRPGRVTIDCDVTPLKNSFFVYNVATPNAISDQEFIRWDSGQQTDSSHNEAGPPSEEDDGPPTDIYLNFRVNATPDATMRLLMDAKTNDYINLNGSGVIRATYYNKGSFQMFGTYTVESGTYDVTIQNIIKKSFQFQPGSTLVFGGDPYQAALNLQALYTVNGVSLSDLSIGNSFASNTIRVNCLMNIGGQPDAPQVTFDLDMPTVNADEKQMVRSLLASQQEMNQQVLYLLTIGRFYSQGQNNAGQQQQAQTTLAMQSFLSGTLSTQINTVLNSVIKNDDWNFGANISTGTEGWNNAEYEGIINGRMLNNRLLINGQFGYRDNATQATPSFIGDFDIRYLLYPNGNLSLKVYNQTNDRYFTRSSLNTQGIGLIMKKDFGNISELFARKKKKERTLQEETQEETQEEE